MKLPTRSLVVAIHAAMGEYEAAIKDYSKAIGKDPKDEMPIVNRASVYMSTGKYEDALMTTQPQSSATASNAAFFSNERSLKSFWEI